MNRRFHSLIPRENNQIIVNQPKAYTSVSSMKPLMIGVTGEPISTS